MYILEGGGGICTYLGGGGGGRWHMYLEPPPHILIQHCKCTPVQTAFCDLL